MGGSSSCQREVTGSACQIIAKGWTHVGYGLTAGPSLSTEDLCAPLCPLCPFPQSVLGTASTHTGEVVTSLGRETPLTAGPQVSWPLPRILSLCSKGLRLPMPTAPKDLEERTKLIPLYVQTARGATEGPKGERVLFQVPAGLAAPGNKEPALWCGCPRRRRP